jgi:transglutaminase-like putative cysteine protease
LALRGGTGRDELMFVLLLGLLFWWVGYTAIWNTVRYQRVWRALLPPGVVLAVNLYYYVGSNSLTPYLMIYLLCALLVVVRSYAVLQERRWLSERIGYNSDVRFDILRSGLILASSAILVAWVAPTAATSETAHELWSRVEGPWRRVEDNFNRMFSTLRSQAQVYGNPFGRTLTLRGPLNLPDTPVLLVQAPSDMRFYWRGIVYDRYTGSGWINTDSDTVSLEAWREPTLASFVAREDITQTFTVLLPVDTLVFAAPQPKRVSLSLRADGRISPDGTGEFSQLISTRSLVKGAGYTAISSLSTADEQELRSAGEDYPAWVSDRYLQLPESLPAMVRAQAKDIAGDLATPYDKASAIEAWLRANVVYDDKTPAPPQGEDGAEYVLTIRRGYCDYYATAMVVMLRSLGVPARVAVGYAQGIYDSTNGVYRVSQKDSHSWVEVYFPQYGWVEFEPTSAQPVIARPTPKAQTGVATPVPTPASADDLRPPRESPDRQVPEGVDLGTSSARFVRSIPRWVWGFGVALLLIAAAFLVGTILERRGLRGLTRTARTYVRLLRFSGWLRVRWTDSQTPHERGAAFSLAVPDASDLILRITDDYTREQYSRVPPGGEGSEQIWQKLAPKLWLTGLRLRAQWFRHRVDDLRRSWDGLSRRLNNQFG